VHEDFPRKMLSKDWIHPIANRAIAAGMAVLEAVAGWLFENVVAATPTTAVRFVPTKIKSLRNFPSLENFPTTSRPINAERPFSGLLCPRVELAAGLVRQGRCGRQVHGGTAQGLLIAGLFGAADEEAGSRARPGWRRVSHLGVEKTR
jgi:hypothetical protein